MITYEIVFGNTEAVLGTVPIAADAPVADAVAAIIEQLEGGIMSDQLQEMTAAYRAEPITAQDSPGWRLFLIYCIDADGEVICTYGAQPQVLH